MVQICPPAWCCLWCAKFPIHAAIAKKRQRQAEECRRRAEERRRHAEERQAGLDTPMPTSDEHKCPKQQEGLAGIGHPYPHSFS